MFYIKTFPECTLQTVYDLKIDISLNLFFPKITCQVIILNMPWQLCYCSKIVTRSSLQSMARKNVWNSYTIGEMGPWYKSTDLNNLSLDYARSSLVNYNLFAIKMSDFCKNQGEITFDLKLTRYVDSTSMSEVTPVTIRYICPPHHGQTSQYHGHEWMTHILLLPCQSATPFLRKGYFRL